MSFGALQIAANLTVSAASSLALIETTVFPSASGYSHTGTFTNAVQAGDQIVVNALVLAAGGVTVTISDSSGNSYDTPTSQSITGSNTNTAYVTRATAAAPAAAGTLQVKVQTGSGKNVTFVAYLLRGKTLALNSAGISAVAPQTVSVGSDLTVGPYSTGAGFVTFVTCGNHSGAAAIALHNATGFTTDQNTSGGNNAYIFASKLTSGVTAESFGVTNTYSATESIGALVVPYTY